MKAVVFTLGCKVNECESNSLISGLIERGYEVSDKLEYADLYIVNTCAVTKEAEKKSRQTVSRIKKLNDKAKIIFNFDRKTKNEKKIMQLAFSAPMSTAEIIKCVDKNIDCILNEDDVVEFLYDDRNITSENIAEMSRNLPATRSVISAISNLYLRKQILFERI